MLIKFKNIVEKYGRPNGIIHIGAHLMEEREDYLELGFNNTIWVEANPDLYNKIIKKIEGQESVFNYVVSDLDDEIVEFNITNNGQSSSILELDKHKIHHPHIYVERTISLKTESMETIINKNNINMDVYDFINIDIQGAELKALQGFGDLLNKIKYIYTEINTNSLYKNCCLVNELDEYLEKYGFERVETYMTEFEWGDALYKNNN
jgi:FkbM family methyltransferase